MKAVSQITITNANGEAIHDIAPDALSKEHQDLLLEGKALPREAGPVCDTVYLIKRMIDLSSYSTRTEQKTADKIYNTIVVTDGKILLEDAQYDLLMSLLSKFTPYLGGRMYAPFHEAMENAETLPAVAPQA